MKKTIYLLFLLSVAPLAASRATATPQVTKGQLLTIENETGHKLFIVENRSFKQLNPEEAVVLYWKEPLANQERVLQIYYGGNSRNSTPEATDSSGKKRARSKKNSIPRSPKPVLIAKLRTNKPGTVVLCYDEEGILKMDRI